MMPYYMAKIWFVQGQRFATLEDLGIEGGMEPCEWSTSNTHTSKTMTLTLAKRRVGLINREWNAAGLPLPAMELVIFFSVDGSKFLESERHRLH